MTDISFIVSAFDRPEMLKCCLASLRVQTHLNIEIIVTDNAENPWVSLEHHVISDDFGVEYIHTKALSPYHSAEIGAKVATGEYLCFPSDDSYYVPVFARAMYGMAFMYNCGLVYCDMVYNGRVLGEPYHYMNVKAEVNHIDKTNFIIHRSVFPGFPDQPNASVPSDADGKMIERVVKAGVTHRKHKGIMVVHN